MSLIMRVSRYLENTGFPALVKIMNYLSALKNSSNSISSSILDASDLNPVFINEEEFLLCPLSICLC